MKVKKKCTGFWHLYFPERIDSNADGLIIIHVGQLDLAIGSDFAVGIPIVVLNKVKGPAVIANNPCHGNGVGCAVKVKHKVAGEDSSLLFGYGH